MNPDPAPLVAAPALVRDRLRLLALLALVALWTLPDWATAQVGDEVHPEKGALRTGVTAALALIALWGLCATSLAARTLRGLRIGAALTDALIALTATGLLVVHHGWIPGGDLREAWVPIFGPLGLLGLLDALLVWRRPATRYDVSVIRAGAALFAATALAVDGSWIPAAIAAWLAVAPLMFLKLQTPRSARRSLEVFVLVAAVIAGLAPWLQRDLVGVHPAVGSELTWPVYLWCVTAALVVTTALDGVLRPEADPRPGH